MTADDIADKVRAALRGTDLHPHLIPSTASRHGVPYLLVSPDGADQVWALRVDGPLSRSAPEDVAAVAERVGLTTPRPTFRHRVHMIVSAPGLERPVSFRTDVFADERDSERALAKASGYAAEQLGKFEVHSSAVDITEA
jgi:hypothetical protein